MSRLDAGRDGPLSGKGNVYPVLAPLSGYSLAHVFRQCLTILIFEEVLISYEADSWAALTPASGMF